MHELIRDITLCILFAWMLGLAAHFSRQPLILAYLIAGFCIGPFGAGWVHSQESISVISELGLIFMLFMICLLYTSPSPRDGLLSRMPSSA